MAKSIFAAQGISSTLKNLRQLISSFPKLSGSVAVVSPKRIHSQLELWKQQLPTVTPFYAVKCNPEPILLEELINGSVNFDCASLREVDEVHDAGIIYSNSSIIYAHPMKSEKDIRTLDSHGISVTVVDSIEECDKLAECEWNGSTFIRVAVEDSGSKMPFSAKFGADRDEIERIARGCKIPISGVSFHVGSGCHDSKQYMKAIDYVSDEVFKILRRYKHKPTTIDIGGGFSANPSEFLPAAKAIRESIYNLPSQRKIIAEPGRFFAQPSQDLFVKVIAKKRGNNGGWRYVIDESLYGHFSCIAFDQQKPAWFRVPSDNDNKRGISDSTLFGRTCDSLDVIAKGKMEDLEVGDWLYFPLMGAYTSATASEFNGFPKPHVIEDIKNGLPDSSELWNLVKDFHKDNANLKYSNALEPIK
jgi:ornithine decarboxylase